MKLGPLLALAPLAVHATCSPAARPNLILMSVDTLRADHLSCYGSEAPTTLPAHASLLTGATPLAHRVHDNVGFRLGEDLETLASTLKARGYRTGGFVGSFVLNRKFGLGRGFDVYSDETPETDRGLRERRGEKVLEEALSWMGAETEAPFFAFLHFFDPHRPYAPPPPHEPLYRGEVAYVDSLLQRLLRHLDESGRADSTVLVVTADHGESLGEHGEDTHGFFLYQSTLHVPLLVRAPAVRGGQRTRTLIRTIDVAPTALALLGVDAPASFEGVSFLSKDGELVSRDVDAYSETFVPRLHYGWSELRSLRRGSIKVVLAPESELYDLDSDPGEGRNRIREEETVARGLLEKLKELPSPQVRPESVDRGTLASLRALGYLGGSSEAPDVPFRELPDPKEKLAAYKELNELSAVSNPTPADLGSLALLLEREPQSTKALSMYGNFLLDLRRPQDARMAFERILAREPESYDGRYGLGRALASLGEADRARVSLEGALELDPGSTEAYYRLSALERSRGDLAASEKWLREGIQAAGGARLYQELTDLLLSSGRASELFPDGPHVVGTRCRIRPGAAPLVPGERRRSDRRARAGPHPRPGRRQRRAVPGQRPEPREPIRGGDGTLPGHPRAHSLLPRRPHQPGCGLRAAGTGGGCDPLL